MVNVTRISPISRFTVDQLVKTGIAYRLPPNHLNEGLVYGKYILLTEERDGVAILTLNRPEVMNGNKLGNVAYHETATQGVGSKKRNQGDRYHWCWQQHLLCWS